jgi:hypothetical protein
MPPALAGRQASNEVPPKGGAVMPPALAGRQASNEVPPQGGPVMGSP